MYTAVSLKDGRLNVDRMEYLKKHNIVYRSPEYKGYDGMCIGNGCFGGMLFHTAKSMEMTLSHTDAIDFAEDGNFEAWSWESEEKNTAPVACAALSISDGMPSFDNLYLKSYENILSLADGSVRMSSKTDFSEWEAGVMCSRGYQVAAFDLRRKSAEPVSSVIRLERWGSRNFLHDFEQMALCTDKNLAGTEAGSEKDCFYVSQKLRGCVTLTMARVMGDGEIIKNNSHSIEFKTTKDCVSFQVYVRCSVLKRKEQREEEIAKFLSDTEKLSMDKIRERQYEEWSAFWEKSFVSLPEADYLENLYYSYLYLLNSCSRGTYPVTFGSIWCPNRDIRNWGHYYHWNHQQIYWGLHTGGHSELMENYYEYRMRMLPQAEKDGKEIYHSRGAFFSDISNYNGYQAIEPDTVRNLTPGSQIAMDFYRNYQYLRDKAFLKEKAYPMMKACARLYEDLLVKEEDGCYRIRGGSTCYEGYWIYKETMTDWAMIKCLFSALTEASHILECDEELREKWADIIENLYPMPIYEDEAGNQYLSAARKWDGACVGYREGLYPYGYFGCCQLACLYPSGVCGLKDKGSELFPILQRSLRLAKEKDFLTRGGDATPGHNAGPQAAARLGDEQTLDILEMFVEKYQVFKNGTCHFLDLNLQNAPQKEYLTRRIRGDERTNWRELHEKDTGERVRVNTEQFLHNYFEAHANIYTGINEMLLQSHDGILRVFPAVKRGMSAVFELYAVGGVKVISEMYKGEILYIALEGIGETVCKVENPWNDRARIMEDDKEITYEEAGRILRFPVQAGKKYLIERCERSVRGFYINEITGKENLFPKFFRGNSIGKEQEL